MEGIILPFCHGPVLHFIIQLPDTMLTVQELRIHFGEKNAIMHISELQKEFC